MYINIRKARARERETKKIQRHWIPSSTPRCYALNTQKLTPNGIIIPFWIHVCYMGNGVFLLGFTISPKTLQELRQLWSTRLLGFNHQDFPGFKKSLLFTTPDSEKTFGNTSRFRKHLWLIPCVVLAIPFQKKNTSLSVLISHLFF